MRDPHGLLARNRALVVGAVVDGGLAEAAAGDDAETASTPAVAMDSQGRRSPEFDLL